MQGSYVNRISKVVMKLVRLVMVGVGVGMFILTTCLSIKSSTNKMEAMVTEYAAEVENIMSCTITQLNGLVMMVEQDISLEDVRKELASRHVIDHKVKQEKMTK